jgi:DeoR family fructose operon transcriptional repressor
MNFQKRKRFILDELNKHGEVDVKRLATDLSISEITIRRDLNNLADKGLLFRTHGGASQVDPLASPYTFTNKAVQNADAKDAICKEAAKLIDNGDIIFMDCGSTVFRLCQFIANKRIRVVTNSLPIIMELQNSLVSLNIIGGEYDAKRQAMHGLIANRHISFYKADKAFIGVDGISANGLFANTELEADITTAFINNSAKTILLCDDGKVGKESYLNFATLNQINTLITNANSLDLALYEEQGIEIIKV